MADGNVSRVGLAEVVLTDGVPTGVRREGVVLAPDAGFERGAANAGVEDPRTTWVPSLGDGGLHVMTYVAYGPLGPKPALAVSDATTKYSKFVRTVCCRSRPGWPPSERCASPDGWVPSRCSLDCASNYLVGDTFMSQCPQYRTARDCVLSIGLLPRAAAIRAVLL